MRTSVLIASMLLAASSPTIAIGPCPDVPGSAGQTRLCLRGTTATRASSDNNRCAPDVPRQFRRLKDHGEVMGFHHGGEGVDYPSLDADGFLGFGDGTDHWQGVQRLAHPPGSQHLLVLTSSHEGGWSHYALVGLNSRAGSGFTGRRFGGNRVHPTAPDWHVVPLEIDRILQKGRIHPILDHPGGLQAIGQFVAIPLEQVGNNDLPGRTQLFDAGSGFNFDIKRCNTDDAGCMRSRRVIEHSEKMNGAVGVVKLDDGRYLMINGLTENMKKLEVNVSRRRPNGTPYRIDESGVFGQSNCAGCAGRFSAKFETQAIPSWRPGYQSQQLISECGSGHIYLLGSTKDGDEDWIDLFRLNLRPTGTNAEGEPELSTDSPSSAFHHVSSKHMWCSYRNSKRQCDFKAAVGTYVDPAGNLIVYATVHDDSPPPARGVTRFVEFGPNDPVDDLGTAARERCDSPSKMWVELSNQELVGGELPTGAERFFSEYGNGIRSSEFETAYDFSDLARSIRYCLPAGHRYRLCEHASLGGACRYFCGSPGGGCSGPVSNGAARGFNLPVANASSGCFVTTASTECE